MCKFYFKKIKFRSGEVYTFLKLGDKSIRHVCCLDMFETTHKGY